jgi:hypothetical protein
MSNEEKLNEILRSGRFWCQGREFHCTGAAVTNGYMTVRGDLAHGPVPMRWAGSIADVEATAPELALAKREEAAA